MGHGAMLTDGEGGAGTNAEEWICYTFFLACYRYCVHSLCNVYLGMMPTSMTILLLYLLTD